MPKGLIEMIYEEKIAQLMLEHDGAAFEQAVSTDKLEKRFKALSLTFAEHLLKCLIFGSSCQPYNHWLNELNGYLKSTLLVSARNNGKVMYIPFALVHDSLFELYLPNLPTTIRGRYAATVKENKDLAPIISADELAEGFFERFADFEEAIYTKYVREQEPDKEFLAEQIDKLRGC